MTCPKCQKVIENSKEMYCPECGMQLRVIPERVVSTTPKLLLPLVIGIASVIAVVVLVFMIGWMISQNRGKEEFPETPEVIYQPLETYVSATESDMVSTTAVIESFTEPEIITQIIVVTETIYIDQREENTTEEFPVYENEAEETETEVKPERELVPVRFDTKNG